MTKLIFIWMLLTNQVTPSGENDGHQMYHIILKDNTVIEYAYKSEILIYIETGTFKYDDSLEFAEK